MKRLSEPSRLLSLIALLCACNSKPAPTPVMTAASWAALGKELGVKFPASARLLGVERENGMDDMARAKVAIAAADLPAFLASTPLAPAAFAPGSGGLLFHDRDWWGPDSALHLRTAQARLASARVLNIGVDDGHPGVVYLYLVNHGT